MHRYSQLRLGKKNLHLIASFLVVGCTQTATGIDVPLPELETAISRGALPVAESLMGQEVAAPIAASISAENIDFEICGESPNWMRLTESDQRMQLREIPRYGAAIEEEPLKSLSQNFWFHEAISFTTYGLSARIEPIYFSGLWTIVDTFSNCYEGSRVEKINAGQMAEVWLISHRVDHIQWHGDRYIMNVQPTGNGVQLIQFPRQETQTSLPLTIVTEDGTEVAVLSGDWR